MLNTQKDSVNVNTTTCAGSRRRGLRRSFLHGLFETRLGRGRAVVLSQPLEIIIDHTREDLIENRRHFHQLEIKELQYKYELFADCVNNKLVLRPEHLFKVKLILFSLRDGHHYRLAIDALKNRSTIFHILLHLLSCRSVEDGLIKFQSGRRRVDRLVDRRVCAMQALLL